MDNLPNTKIAFDKLPKMVKDAYFNNLDYYGINTLVINLDKSKITLIHYCPNAGLNLASSDFFIIGKKKFELLYHKAHPFILYDKIFYYTDTYNLSTFNYLEANFIGINLGSYLKY